jgi:hypothetical protein
MIVVLAHGAGARWFWYDVEPRILRAPFSSAPMAASACSAASVSWATLEPNVAFLACKATLTPLATFCCGLNWVATMGTQKKHGCAEGMEIEL